MRGKMKASELIAALQSIIDAKGDLPVCCTDGYECYLIYKDQLIVTNEEPYIIRPYVHNENIAPNFEVGNFIIVG